MFRLNIRKTYSLKESSSTGTGCPGVGVESLLLGVVKRLVNVTLGNTA